MTDASSSSSRAEHDAPDSSTDPGLARDGGGHCASEARKPFVAPRLRRETDLVGGTAEVNGAFS
jgi:hypothetical protein